MKEKYSNIIALAVSLTLVGCASQLPSGGSYVESFIKSTECAPTKLSYLYVSEPDDHWRRLLKESTDQVNSIIVSDTFAKQCQTLKMNRTNGKNIQEVCREIACSGEKTIRFGFFNRTNTTAIARELGNGVVEFNIAKPNSGAGKPGNIVHEFTHTLGYTHFTNFSWLGKYSVPYEVGGLVDNLAK